MLSLRLADDENCTLCALVALYEIGPKRTCAPITASCHSARLSAAGGGLRAQARFHQSHSRLRSCVPNCDQGATAGTPASRRGVPTRCGTNDGRRLEALRTRLRDLGHIEGQNIPLTVRWNEGGLDRLSELAAELLRDQPDASGLPFRGPFPSASRRNATTTTGLIGLLSAFQRPTFFDATRVLLCRVE